MKLGTAPGQGGREPPNPALPRPRPAPQRSAPRRARPGTACAPPAAGRWRCRPAAGRRRGGWAGGGAVIYLILHKAAHRATGADKAGRCREVWLKPLHAAHSCLPLSLTVATLPFLSRQGEMVSLPRRSAWEGDGEGPRSRGVGVPPSRGPPGHVHTDGNEGDLNKLLDCCAKQTISFKILSAHLRRYLGKIYVLPNITPLCS